MDSTTRPAAPARSLGFALMTAERRPETAAKPLETAPTLERSAGLDARAGWTQTSTFLPAIVPTPVAELVLTPPPAVVTPKRPSAEIHAELVASNNRILNLCRLPGPLGVIGGYGGMAVGQMLGWNDGAALLGLCTFFTGIVGPFVVMKVEDRRQRRLRKELLASIA